MVGKFLIAACLLVMFASGRCADYEVKLAENLSVIVREDKFEALKHNVTGCGRPNQECAVDGNAAYGAMGVPKSSLTRVTVKTGNENYQLDTTGMFNPLLDSTIEERIGGFCYDSKNCAFRAILGDAGGIYAVEWVIVNGKARRTILTDSQDVFEFFRKNLTPPQYH